MEGSTNNPSSSRFNTLASYATAPFRATGNWMLYQTGIPQRFNTTVEYTQGLPGRIKQLGDEALFNDPQPLKRLLEELQTLKKEPSQDTLIETITKHLEEVVKNPEKFIGRNWANENGKKEEEPLTNLLDTLKKAISSKGEIDNINSTTSIDIDTLNSAINSVKTLCQQAEGLLIKAKSWVSAYLSHEMQQAKRPFYLLQNALNALINNPKPTKEECLEASKWLEEITKPEYKLIFLNKFSETYEITKENEFEEEYDHYITLFKNYSEALKENKEPIETYRQGLKEAILPTVTLLIQFQEGLFQQTVSSLIDRVSNPQTGALPQLIGQTNHQMQQILENWAQDAPEPLLNIYTKLTALLRQVLDRKQIEEVITLLNDFDGNFGNKWQENEKTVFLQLKTDLENFLRINQGQLPEMNSTLKKSVRNASKSIEEMIKDSSGQAMQVIFKVKNSLLHPETGLAQELQSQITNFLETQLRQADGNLLTIPIILQKILSTQVAENDIDKAINVLIDLRDNPTKFLGRNWNGAPANNNNNVLPQQEDETRYISQVLTLLSQKDKTNINAAKPFIQDKLLPQIRKYIKERQGPAFQFIDAAKESFIGEGGLLDQALQRAEEKVADLEEQFTRKPHKDLEHAHKLLLKFYKSMANGPIDASLKKSVLQALNKLHQNAQTIFNPKHLIDIDIIAIENDLASVCTDIENTTEQISKEEMLKKLGRIAEILEQHIQNQSGTITKTIDAAAERIEKRMLETFENVEQNLMDRLRPLTTALGINLNAPQEQVNTHAFVSNNNNYNSNAPSFSQQIETQNAPEVPASSTIHRLFDSAISLVNNVAGEFGQLAARQALAWPCDLLVNFLNKAKVSVNQIEDLDQNVKTQAIQALDNAIQKVGVAKSQGTIESYRTALHEAKAALSPFPVLVNGVLELPSIQRPQAPTNQQNLLEMQTQMLRRLDGLRNPPATDTTNWAQETNEQKEIFKVNASFLGTFKFVEWMCGNTDIRGQIDERIRGEIHQLEETPQYQSEFERLRRNYGYYDQNLPQDDTFSTIMGTFQTRSPAEKKDQFIQRVREYIDLRADVSGFTKWITKLSLPLVHFMIHFLVNRFSDGVVDFAREEIRRTQLDPLKPVTTEPISRSSAWLQTYLNLLQAYANDRTNTHDRESYLRILMNDPTFNHGYQGNEIFAAFSKKAVETLFPNMNWTSWINNLSHSVGEWKYSETFSSSSSLNSLNYLTKAAKWMIGGTLQTAFFVGLKVPFKIMEIIANRALKFGMKRFLTRTELVKNIFDSSKFSLYQETPFTSAIDKVLRDQLKEIWNLMQRAAETNMEPGPQFDGVKEKLQELLKTMFKILETNGLSSPQEFRNFFDSSSILSNLQQSGFNLILPDVIDSVSRLIFIAYQSIFQENQLERQASQAFKLVNEAILSSKTPLTEEERRRNAAEFARTREEIQDILNNILYFSVSQAVEQKINDFGRAKQAEANRILDEIKVQINGKDDPSATPNHTDGFIDRYTKALSQLNQELLHPGADNSDPQILERRKDVLNSMRQDIETIAADLNNKLLSVRHSNLGDATKAQITEVINEMTQKVDALSLAFRDLYIAQIEYIAKKTSLAPMRSVEEGIKRIKEMAQQGLNSGYNPDLIHQMREQLRRVVLNGYNKLLEIPNQISPLANYKNHINPTELENTIKTFENHKILLDQIQAFKSILETLTQNKIQVIEEQQNRNVLGNLAHALIGRQSPFAQTASTAQQIIEKFPEQLDRQVLLSKLQEMKDTQDNAEARRIHNEINGLLTQFEDRNNQLVQRKSEALNTLNNDLVRLETEVKTIASRSDQNPNARGFGYIQQLKNVTDELKTQAQNIHPLHVLPINVIDHSPFISWAKDYIYDQLKKRSEAEIELLRNPLMFDGFLRHVFLFNFVESNGGDRRHITPPPAFPTQNSN